MYLSFCNAYHYYWYILVLHNVVIHLSIHLVQICAFKEGIDTCNGDSGGPLTIDYKRTVIGETSDPKRVLVGVVSYGPRFCADNK